MMYRSAIKTVLFFLLAGTGFLYAATLSGKKFDIESGIVLFEVSGGGEIAEDVNISISGEGQLRFNDWGVFALIEENYEELTTGLLKGKNKIQLCEKFENKQRFDVDFETEQIFERPMPKGAFKSYYLKDMVKTGQEKIAGYTCDVWEGAGVKKCLYKGLPLLVENRLLGMYYRKKAIDVSLNVEVEPSNCELPDFPVEKFALFKTSIKTKSINLPKELSSAIVTVAKELKHQNLSEENLTIQQKQIWLNKMGQNLFERQKIFLPEMLHTMKETRVCLQQVDNVNEANACILDIINMKKEIFADKNNYISAWDEKGKAKVLDEFDDNILLLESKMKCIRAAQNIADLSHCMKQTL